MTDERIEGNRPPDPRKSRELLEGYVTSGEVRTLDDIHGFRRKEGLYFATSSTLEELEVLELRGKIEIDTSTGKYTVRKKGS